MANSSLNRLDVKISLMVTILLSVVIIIGAFFMIKQQGNSLEAQMRRKGQILSILGAKMMSRVIEEAIDNGVFTLKEVFDENYQRIPNFDPPKYHTKYDAYFDKSILSIQDEFLKDKSIVFAIAVDRNGYVPTHNSRFQKPPTGDKEKDTLGNRTKRIFNEGIELKAAKNEEEGLIQQYQQRDTGDSILDISSPIVVKGKHWGAFRVGYSLKSLSEAKTSLMFSLLGFMIVILIISTISVFFLINNSLKPLKEFTRIANDLAGGKVDEKIEVTSQDEIGQLADVLERLRISIKTAMDRLLERT